MLVAVSGHDTSPTRAEPTRTEPPHDPAATDDPVGDLVLALLGATDAELDDVVSDTLRLMGERCGAERTYITFFDREAGTFDISHEWTRGVVPHRPAIQRIRIDRFPWSVAIAERQEVLVVDDVEALTDEAAAERASFGAFGVRSIMQIPIVHGGVTVGVAGLNRFEPNEGWQPETVELARRIGQACGVALLRLHAERDMAEERRRAGDARRARDELLAHVSHELRTPLHAILGYAELLELDERSDHDRDALMRIQTNGRQLLAMIDDLADLARGANDDGSQRRPTTDVRSVVAEIVGDMQHVAGDRGLSLHGAAPDAVADVEVGRLRQVLRCLVIGAAQSMRDGSIAVGASVADGSTDVHVDLVSSSPINDSGLVLPMTEALVHGYGRVRVEPSESASGAAGHGTRVVVTFTPSRPDR
jgi:signal transduction histidine kinase